MAAKHQQYFLENLDFELPRGYLVYLSSPESTYDFGAAYLIEAEDLVEYNARYEAAEFYPGYFLIGSNGGGEAIAIEKATGNFVLTPFIGHDEETPGIIGRTWDEFLQRLQADNLSGNE